MTLPHGGNIYHYSRKYGIPASEFLDFSASINPLGPSASAMAALKGAIGELINYPDPTAGTLMSALSGRLSVPVGSLLPGNGSTELIYLLPRALRPVRALLPVPSFSEYERALKLAGCGVSCFPLRERDGFVPDMARLTNALKDMDMLVLCNPNNPTGVLLGREVVFDIIGAARKAGVFTVVDEAFIEYAPGFSIAAEASRMKGVAVLRNFTKFHGMPGLRAGYLVAHPSVVEKISKSKEPWSMNTLAERAATAALADDTYAEKSMALVEREKAYLYRGLKGIPGMEPYPPTVNFVFAKVTKGGVTAATLTESLAERGVLVRDCSNFWGLDKCFIRVAVKKRADNRALLGAMKSAISFTRP